MREGPRPYILSLDPGLMSGLAIVQREPLEAIETAELEPKETARWMDHQYRTYGGENIDSVCERYTITNETAKKSQQPWSLEITGMIRLLSWAHGSGEITLQQPVDAKRFATNPRLKAVGLWHVGGGGHALDALRHVVLRMVNQGWRDSRLLLD